MKYISKKELMEIINRLENAQDKFIVLGIYSGLMRVSNTDILNLKVSDVDFINKTINVNGMSIAFDEELEKIIKESITQQRYYKLGEQGRSNEYYLLNTSSPYIIKLRPLPSNKNGSESMSVDTLKQRLIRLSSFLGVNGMNTRLLKQSGAFNLLKEENKEWTLDAATKFLNEKGFNLRRNNILDMIKELRRNVV
ncbi:tyrosine-type recombinase/integrase [Clostridium paraputrificum]